MKFNVSFEFSKDPKRVKGLVSKEAVDEEILIDWSLLIEWGIITEKFPLPPHNA